MDVPQTVTTALEDRPVAGATCLEAGAGVGNTTAGLLDAGARRVCAVTNDADHARTVRERVGRAASDRGGESRHADDSRRGDESRNGDESECAAVLEADLRDLPMADDSVDVITAHGLFNVLPPESLDAVASELTRVAASNCHLVVDDYAPLPDDAEMRDLFAVENAATELADGRPALSFYPAGALRRLFEGYGWVFDRRKTLLDPVPWTESHVEAHADVARSAAERLPDELGGPLVEEAGRLAESIGEESVGEMYSVAMRLES